MAGQWMDGSHRAAITDYDPDEDRLVYLFDGDGVPVPEIRDTASGDAIIDFGDGGVIRVVGAAGLTFDAIDMVIREPAPGPAPAPVVTA